MSIELALALSLLLLPSQASAKANKPRPRISSQPQKSIPDEARRLAAEAREAEARGDWQSAEQRYQKALELAPYWAEVFVNLGVVYNRLGRIEDAIRSFTAAAKLDKNLVAAPLNLGITQFRASRHQEALPPLRRVIQLEPQNSQARQLIALSLIALERFREAAIELERLRAVNKSDPALLLALGQAYMRLKQYDKSSRAAGSAHTR